MPRRPTHDGGHAAGQVRSSSIDRWSARVVLILGSFVALGAVGLVRYRDSDSPKVRAEVPAPNAAPEPTLPWFEGFEPELDSIVAACTPLVTESRSVVVFSNGTCVLVNEPAEDPVGFAKGVIILTASKSELPISTPVDGGHLLVTHHGPVHHYFFSKQFDRQHRVFAQWEKGLRPGELDDMKQKGFSEKQMKGASLARQLLRRDAGEPKAVKLLKARPAGQAGPPVEESAEDRTAGPASPENRSSPPAGMPADPPPLHSQ